MKHAKDPIFKILFLIQCLFYGLIAALLYALKSNVH